MTDRTKDRVYVVEVQGQAPRLVRAAHPVHAIRHVAKRLLAVKLASQDDLIALVGKGASVELASDDATEDPAGGGNGHDQAQGFLGIGT